MSDIIRDSGSTTLGTEQGRWQAELSQAAIELIGVSISTLWCIGLVSMKMPCALLVFMYPC